MNDNKERFLEILNNIALVREYTQYIPGTGCKKIVTLCVEQLVEELEDNNFFN